MSSQHDEIDDLPRTPDEPASSSEAAQAQAFSRLVDKLVAGQDLPPVMDEEERSLIDTAAIMRANLRESEIPAVGFSSLIENVLSDAHSARARREEGSEETAGDARPGDAGTDGVIDLAARRQKRASRVRRFVPWSVAAVAAAAALLFALRTPTVEVRTERQAPQVSQVSGLSRQHLSRPADALVGQIPRTQADRASHRMDMIYADRMAGYRDLTLRGVGR